MGKTMMGGSTHEKNISMLTPEQQTLFSSMIQQLGPQAMESFSSMLQPMGQEQMDQTFQKSYVDPAMQTFQQQVVPGIQQRFADAGAGSSSALNQTLAQSAGDLSTSLGSQYGQFSQNQQQLQQQALSQFLPMLTGQTFSPHISKQQGILGPLVQGGMQGAGLYARSSKEVKENIRDYDKGLRELENISVKQYDYKQEFGGEENRVGLIAEEIPAELTAVRDGILHVDLYGVMGLMINAIQDLSLRVEELENS